MAMPATDCRRMMTATFSPASCAAKSRTSKVYENEWALAFDDIDPQAPVHVLVIPKSRYCSFADFSAWASDAEIAGFVRAVGHVARMLGLEDAGYRVLANMGAIPGRKCHIFTCIYLAAVRWARC